MLPFITQGMFRVRVASNADLMWHTFQKSYLLVVSSITILE